MLEEALEHLVKGIVEHPDEVRVRARKIRTGRVLEVRVHPEDLGKVIGRGGRTAKALRTVVNALSDGKYVRVDLRRPDRGPLKRDTGGRRPAVNLPHAQPVIPGDRHSVSRDRRFWRPLCSSSSAGSAAPTASAVK